jgi:Transcriptional regulators
MPAKRVTIADVAAAAGTSVTAVSLVLNRKPGSRISEETSQRIRAAAKELNYSANPTARSLRTRRSSTIGFISDEVTVTRYASALIRGCITVAERAGNLVLINECPFDPDSLGDTIAAMNARNVDALVFALMRAHHVDIPELPSSVNAVILNGTATVGGESEWSLPSVLPDEFDAGLTAARRLLTSGHTRIALIGRDARHRDASVSVTVTDRMRGLDTALSERGIVFAHEIHSREWEPELGWRVRWTSSITIKLYRNLRESPPSSLAMTASPSASIRPCSDAACPFPGTSPSSPSTMRSWPPTSAPG